MALGSAQGRIWHSTYYTALRKWQGPVIVTVFDMIHERFPHLFSGSSNEQLRRQKRRCILRADVILCISQTTQKDVQQFFGIDADRTRVVPLASSEPFRILDKADGGSKLPTKKPFLLYVGTGRDNHKNFRVLVQAYRRWPGKDNFDLVVVGKPWSEDEMQHFADIGIMDRVHLLTHVNDEELCRLYNRACAFVYPSLFEGFGIPVLEAMACGCPVIASRIPTTLEVAGDCPVYFDPATPDSLVAAFDKVLSEGRNADRVRVGVERVKRYSWEETARQILEVYRELSGTE
jgi:glycosyltransferase involved in cell wall biosynthesis